jgi:hypothetical protein
MTLIGFQSLSQREQCEVTLRKGEPVSDRIDDDFTLLIYQLYTFTVELYFHTATNELVWINSYESSRVLDPHLSSLDVSKLVS